MNKIIAKIEKMKTQNNETLKEVIVPELLSFVERNYKVTPKQILGRSRKAKIAIMRSLLIFTIYENKYYNISLKQVGRLFDNRDHSTILNANKTATNLIQTNFESNEIYNAINNEFEKLHYYYKKAIF